MIYSPTGFCVAALGNVARESGNIFILWSCYTSFAFVGCNLLLGSKVRDHLRDMSVHIPCISTNTVQIELQHETISHRAQLCRFS